MMWRDLAWNDEVWEVFLTTGLPIYWELLNCLRWYWTGGCRRDAPNRDTPDHCVCQSSNVSARSTWGRWCISRTDGAMVTAILHPSNLREGTCVHFACNFSHCSPQEMQFVLVIKHAKLFRTGLNLFNEPVILPEDVENNVVTHD